MAYAFGCVIDRQGSDTFNSTNDRINEVVQFFKVRKIFKQFPRFVD